MALFSQPFPLSLKLEKVASHALLCGLFWSQCLGCITSASAEPVPNRVRQVAQVQAQQMPAIGVVQSAENQAHWQEITTRLAATGLDYQIIDWNTIQRSGDFGNVSVLFLPNIETITADQLLGLQAWLNRGGRVIVSGMIGSQSSAGVQQALRSLLGAYWASDLSQAQSLQPLQLASQRWIRQASTASTLIGGVIVPTSLSSQPVAVWNRGNPSGSATASSEGAAVVVTQRSTFLGWRWGDPAASLADLDSSWLRAAVSRFQDVPPLQSVANAATATPAQRTPAASTTQERPNRGGLSSNPASETSSTALSLGASGQSIFGRTMPPMPQPRPETASPRTTTSQDPAEQVAPAELDIERKTRITLYEATSMQQELENLIGRYESALILSNSRANTRLAEAAQVPKTGGTADVLGATVPVGSAVAARSIDDAILTQARQGYDTFSRALRQQDYATARQQWLATRQLLWDNFPLDRPLSQPEVRAMWLDRGTIVRAGSRQGLAQIFDRLAEAGINTVFFETVNAGYPVYPSRIAPAQNPLTRHWDPLAEAVELAHQRDMELHAWVWTFAAGNQVHNPLINQPASYPGPILAARPDWANYDNRAQMIPPGQTKPFLDPANPEVRSYLLNLFEEIVTRYKVDGLHLDYIRYPFQDPRTGGHTYGYGMAARQQFYRLTGVDPITLSPGATRTSAAAGQSPQQRLWQQWTAFRAEQVNSFVADTSRLVRRLNPELVLSTAVFAIPERQRVNEIQQNWELWAQRGDVDMIVLMSYASDTNGLQRLANPWLSRTDLGSTLILPGIRMLNLSDATVIDQIQALRDSSSGGFALFAAENLNSHLQTIFNRMQGEASVQTTEPIPYRQPFDAAASRYAVLLQQWNWLLENGQLQLGEGQLESWRTKTTALDEALQALANQPSSQNLQQAQTQLSSFQNQFKTWINLPALSEDYRVRTWQNQLATIEMLLEYGDRVVLTRQGTHQAGTP
ncbi:MAG: family 10 glycosylhydrolase [Cyanobacteria bacterium RM1_2_2]|nr:family 10 glycosylhydrolase [Cyanobacteria bacterium RM1_2_2]